ncbi:Probable protein phosphatase 2C 35 [Linum grandiflorum]
MGIKSSNLSAFSSLQAVIVFLGFARGRCPILPAIENGLPSWEVLHQLLVVVGRQRGYYRDQPDKENEDSYIVKIKLQGNPHIHFFGVFAGHGQFGTQCSTFVNNRLFEILENDSTLSDDPIEAYNSVFSMTNSELHNSEINDTMSGMTAITILVVRDRIYMANVGDSRAVMGVRRRDKIVVEELS